MKLPEDEIIVMDIAGNQAVIACSNPSKTAALYELGFALKVDRLVHAIGDDEQCKSIVLKLLGLDALFSAGRDWSPAELLDFYREKGVIDGCYRVISWRGPGDYSISIR